MNKSRIILSSIVGCMSLAVLSITFSLAWYANSDRLSVDTLNMTISGDINLKISDSPEIDSFVSDLNGEDLEESAINFFFSPVSSMLKSNWMNEKLEKPIFYDCSFPGVSSEPFVQERTDGFFSQKLYLLSDRDFYAGLDISKCLFTNNSSANLIQAENLLKNNPEWDLSAAEIAEKLDTLLNCLRISILVSDQDNYQYIIIDPTKQENDEVQFGGRLDNDADGYYDSYQIIQGPDHGSLKEIIYGEVNNRSLIKYDEPTELDVDPINTSASFGNSFIAATKGTVYGFNAEESKQNGLVFATEESVSLEELDVDEPSFQIPCYENQPREIVISIYLEGWDLDCINMTMGASFITKLSFKLLRGNL